MVFPSKIKKLFVCFLTFLRFQSNLLATMFWLEIDFCFPPNDNKSFCKYWAWFIWAFLVLKANECNIGNINFHLKSSNIVFLPKCSNYKELKTKQQQKFICFHLLMLLRWISGLKLICWYCEHDKRVMLSMKCSSNWWKCKYFQEFHKISYSKYEQSRSN